MLTRRGLIAGSAAAVLSNSTAFARPPRRLRSRGRDRIIPILCDDLFDLFYFRSRRAPDGRPLFGVPIRAPNILNLATQSVRFSEAQCSTPTCCPSRAAIISGLHGLKTGVVNNDTPWFDAFDLHTTLPGLLNAAGYRCSMFGKITHGGPLAGPRGTLIWRDQGICEVVSGGAPRNGETEDQGVVRTATDYVQQVMASSFDRFCMMVGFKGTHEPSPDRPDLLGLFPLDHILVPEWLGDPASPCNFSGEGTDRGEWLIMTELEKKIYIQGYLADLYAMDREIGRFIASLDATGVDATILLASDHGYMLGDHNMTGKFQLWNEACRVPLLLRYPDCPAGMVIPETVSTLDIMPTLLHHANIERPTWLHGQSLFGPINGNIRDEGAMVSRNDDVSFLDNQYRITRYAPCAASGGQYTFELYDKNADPVSTDNLWDEPGFEAIQADMVAKLNDKLAQWQN